jgi:hypothetical protein
MPDMKVYFLKQIDDVLDQFREIDTQHTYRDFSDIKFETYSRFSTLAISVINRVSGPNSVYSKQADSLIVSQKMVTELNFRDIPILAGILIALRHDIENGFVNTITELIHGEVFVDFLEMANYLLTEGYKDAAAIMGGGVLENHLHQLCTKNSIDLEIIVSGRTQAKRADRLNSDLASANVYTKLDQKNVTAWLDLRNNAAHADYGKYLKEQVALFLQGIQDFITRCPA